MDGAPFISDARWKARHGCTRVHSDISTDIDILSSVRDTSGPEDGKLSSSPKAYLCMNRSRKCEPEGEEKTVALHAGQGK